MRDIRTLYVKTLSAYSRATRRSKRCSTLFLLLLICLLLVWASFVPVSAQSVHKTVISRASRLDVSHTGIHTDANYLLFDTGALDLLALQRDPAHYPQLTFKAHSSLPTNHAALPPDLAVFSSPSDPPLENPYGPIDGGSGKPGWTVLPGHENGKNIVKVLVPSRFANWLAGLSLARRKPYLQPQSYTLVITWNPPKSGQKSDKKADGTGYMRVC